MQSDSGKIQAVKGMDIATEFHDTYTVSRVCVILPKIYQEFCYITAPLHMLTQKNFTLLVESSM